MNRAELIDTLESWDAKKRRVFTVNDLRQLFPNDTELTFRNGLQRFSDGENPILKRAARGVYVYGRSRFPWTHAPEEIARTLRRDHHVYVSLESALSEHGLISQIPIDTLTLVTTGRPGSFTTAWGTIEFVHTGRDLPQFVDHLRDVGRPLPLATPALALGDLRRNARNLHLVRNLGDIETEATALPAPGSREVAAQQEAHDEPFL